jgi:hypothetical protein
LPAHDEFEIVDKNSLNNDNIITTTWRFHVKSYIQFKVRLTARGCQHVPGIDVKRFFPVLSKPSFRLLIINTKILQKPIHTVDITSAFLHTKLRSQSMYINLKVYK